MLNCRTPEMINFPFGTNVKLNSLGVTVFNPVALRKAKIAYNRVEHITVLFITKQNLSI